MTTPWSIWCDSGFSSGPSQIKSAGSRNPVILSYEFGAVTCHATPGGDYRGDMSIAQRLLRASIEPAVGLVYLVLWINAEAGRGVVGIVAMILFAIAIGLSRALPYIALSLVAATLLAQAIGVIAKPSSTDWPDYLAIAIVVGLVSATGNSRVRLIGLIVGIASAATAAALMVFQWDGWISWVGGKWLGDSAPLPAAGILAAGGVVLVMLACAAGYALAARVQILDGSIVAKRMRQQLESSEVELAVAEERNRIAQEMHDVLAHSLAVVVAQADGARYLRPTKPDSVDVALRAISDSARSALGDVRGIIDGILEGGAAPQPGMDDLPLLLDGIRSTGLDVALTEWGDREPLIAVQQLALYRITQEFLTNALRHRGRDSSVSLVLDWRGPGVSLLFLSSGGAAPMVDDSRIGRGVIGMRERARSAGGWLSVGPDEATDEGGHNAAYRLTAFIPFYASERASGPLEIESAVAG
jgi:signal transduction histidine kinase